MSYELISAWVMCQSLCWLAVVCVSYVILSNPVPRARDFSLFRVDRLDHICVYHLLYWKVVLSEAESSFFGQNEQIQVVNKSGEYCYSGYSKSLINQNFIPFISLSVQWRSLGPGPDFSSMNLTQSSPRKSKDLRFSMAGKLRWVFWPLNFRFQGYNDVMI